MSETNYSAEVINEKTPKEKSKKLTVIYLCVTVFTAIFGAVYSAFGHGIISYPMKLAFLFPLVMGLIPSFILSLNNSGVFPKLPARYLWHSSISLLTIGSVLRGVLDIYGNNMNPYPRIYVIAGCVFAAAAVISQFIFKNKESME